MLSDHRFIVNFQKYQFLLTQLVKRDIKVKYRNSVLGIFWSFLEPLLFMIIMTIVFSFIFKRCHTQLSCLLPNWNDYISVIC